MKVPVELIEQLDKHIPTFNIRDVNIHFNCTYLPANMTFGNHIFIRRSYCTWRLFAHEFGHVTQYHFWKPWFFLPIYLLFIWLPWAKRPFEGRPSALAEMIPARLAAQVFMEAK